MGGKSKQLFPEQGTFLFAKAVEYGIMVAPNMRKGYGGSF